MRKHPALALAVALVSAPAAADTPTLAASSPWNMDYGEYRCTLKRTFGEGDDLTILHIEQIGLGNFYNLLLAGPANRKARGSDLTIRFGQEAASERGFLKGRYKETKTPFIVMHGIHLAPPVRGSDEPFVAHGIGPEREAAITDITFGYSPSNGLVLKTGPLDQPLAAMRTCIRDLVSQLGLDEAGQAALESKPEPIDMDGFVRKMVQVYPIEALRNEEEGLVKLRVLVSREGKPEGCQIYESTRPATFDDMVCFFMMRELTFKPARDANGQPAAGVYEASVRYVLPD